MEEWKEYQLKDVTTILGDGLHGTPKYDENGTVFFINGNNLVDGKIEIKDSTKRVSEYEANKYRKNLTPRTILVSINGTIGNVAKYKGEACILGKSACYFNVADNFDLNFIYYVIASQQFKDTITHLATGTTIKNVSLETMRNYSFMAPSINEQKRISSILSSFDDKIELNRRINDNLEQQAQALFKSWFVDFEPFRDDEFIDSELGKIPKGWEIGTIEDLCQNIASGSTPSSMNQEYYNGEIKWFTTKELKDSFLIDSEKHISDEGHKNSSTKMFPRGTVLMAIYAAPTVGRLGILTSDATFNQAAVGLNPKQEIGSNYVFLLLKKERDNFNNLAIGAAQQNLSVKFVKTYPIIIPSEKVIVDFNVLVNPFFDRISLLSKEIEALTGTRDTLLPKLMSGKLRISEIEKEK